ncbi:MAG TPA: DUF2254 family protein [Thermomicrobiaceae bacterium]|nr:DUF2254 family protein [Thermomicrobiaceae bacterium]
MVAQEVIEYRQAHVRAHSALTNIARAYQQFLKFPALVLLAFLALAVISYLVDQSRVGWIRPLRGFMAAHIFSDPQQTASLLSSIAGSLITVTSITFSIVLLAVQQSASTMTHQVIDQFLSRKLNQVIFGFFVGLALYALIVQATVNPPFDPVFGATLVLCFTGVALTLLLVLIYTTIDQMRPPVIVSGIRDLTLAARGRQHGLLAKTRAALPGSPRLPLRVVTADSGFLISIDIDGILDAVASAPAPVEVEFAVSIGAFLTVGDTVACLGSDNAAGARSVGEALVRAIRIEHGRDLTSDPSYGIEQLRTIAWTTISTSKQNPAVAVTVVQALRDLLARWQRTDAARERALTSPVAYADAVDEHLFLALEQLAVIASKSAQSMTYAALLDTIADMIDRGPEAWQERLLAALGRILPLLPDFSLTANLEQSVTQLRQTLGRRGRATAAEAVGYWYGKLAGDGG